MKRVKVYFVRHAQSTGNALESYAHKDSPLSQLGEHQAKKLGECCSAFFNQPAFDSLYMSAQLRAMQTAELAFPDIKKIIEPNFCETDFGDCQGWSFQEFDSIYTDFWASFDPFRSYPGGESHHQMYERTIKSIKHILLETKKKEILIVAHGGTLASIFHWIMNIPLSKFPALKVYNASLSCFDIHITGKANFKGYLQLQSPLI